VVVPADRREQQAGERGREQARDLMPGPVQDGRAGDAGDPDEHGRDDPLGLGPGDAPGEPGQQAAQRLVAFPAGEPGPAALEEQAAEPPLGRVRALDGEPEQHSEHERGGGHGGLPELAREQQVRDENERHELDAGRDADPGSLPPPGGLGVRLAQVPEDERHQQQVDLAEI
jgi:hypothetical protein